MQEVTEQKAAPESELNGLIKKFVEARDLRLNCDRMSKELKIKEDLLEQELWSLLESLNLKSVKTEEYGLISRTFRRDRPASFPNRRKCRDRSTPRPRRSRPCQLRYQGAAHHRSCLHMARSCREDISGPAPDRAGERCARRPET